jgi:hypothetical protein
MITNNYQFIFDRLTQTLSDIFNKNQPVATHGYYASILLKQLTTNGGD